MEQLWSGEDEVELNAELDTALERALWGQPAAPLAEARWHVALKNGTSLGPLTERSVRGLFEAGELGPDTLCWTDGGYDWGPISARKEFLHLKPQAPPLEETIYAPTLKSLAARDLTVLVGEDKPAPPVIETFALASEPIASQAASPVIVQVPTASRGMVFGLIVSCSAVAVLLALLGFVLGRMSTPTQVAVTMPAPPPPVIAAAPAPPAVIVEKPAPKPVAVVVAAAPASKVAAPAIAAKIDDAFAADEESDEAAAEVDEAAPEPVAPDQR